MMKIREINFDMDGTFVDLYGVDGWLEMLVNKNATPYAVAKPLVNLSSFARMFVLMPAAFRISVFVMRLSISSFHKRL